MPYCKKCGKELEENSKFCPECGENEEAASEDNKEEKNLWQGWEKIHLSLIIAIILLTILVSLY